MIRRFNKTEQSYINTLIENDGYQRNILTLVDPYLSKTRLTIDRESEEIKIQYEIEDKHPTDKEYELAIKKIDELQPLIVTICNLLTYLEKQGLITIYSPVKSNGRFIPAGTGAVNRLSIENKLPDNNICKIFISFIHKEIIPSEELVQLSNNNFVPADELKFKKQMVATWVSIIIAALIGISGIIYQIIDGSKNSKRTEMLIKNINTEISKLNDTANSYKTESIQKSESLEKAIKSINESIKKLNQSERKEQKQ